MTGAPEFGLTWYWLLPSDCRPAGLEKFAIAIWPNARLRPFEKIPVTTPFASMLNDCRVPVGKPSCDCGPAVDVPESCVSELKFGVIVWGDPEPSLGLSTIGPVNDETWPLVSNEIDPVFCAATGGGPAEPAVTVKSLSALPLASVSPVTCQVQVLVATGGVAPLLPRVNCRVRLCASPRLS